MKQYFDNYDEMKKAIEECLGNGYSPMFLEEFTEEEREEIARKSERFGLYKRLLVHKWFSMNVRTTLKQDLKPSEKEKRDFDSFKAELGKTFNMVMHSISIGMLTKAGYGTAKLPNKQSVDIYIPQILIDEFKP